jgi:hypothetical protein
MAHRQHAVDFYGTEPETAPYPGIEVVNDPAEKYFVPREDHQQLPASEKPQPKNRICGLSRPTFLLAVALSVLAMVVIGLGAGLGVALNKAGTTDGYNTGKQALMKPRTRK